MKVFEAEALGLKLEKEKVDISLPGKRFGLGAKHPLTLITEEIEDIFIGLGYTIAEGPEVETDYYNFEALEYPPGPSGPGYAGLFLF